MGAIAVAVMLLVCGAIAARSGTTSQPSTPTALLTSSHHCEAAELKTFVDKSAARRTTDGTWLPIDVVNMWKEECVLRGYVPVTGVATAGGQDARAAHASGSAATVILGQFYTAHIWVLIANAHAAGCRQLTASGLRVGMPATTGHIWISYPFTACAGTGQAMLSIRPVMQGLANPAVFP